MNRLTQALRNFWQARKEAKKASDHAAGYKYAIQLLADGTCPTRVQDMAAYLGSLSYGAGMNEGLAKWESEIDSRRGPVVERGAK